MARTYRHYSSASIDVGSTRPMLSPYLRDSDLELLTATEEEKPRCRICWEELVGTPSPMPCGHHWCTPCIVKACHNVRNESQWPIACSRYFASSCFLTFDTAKPFLSNEEIQRLASLIEEFESPKLGRTYCSNRRCGIFVPRREAKDRIAHCQACQTKTCSDCKGSAHKADICPLPDHSEQRILMLSHKEKWQRCTQCGQMCEKSDGCSHMTCLCGYDFCYRCAGPYSECNCEIEHDRRLAMERANPTTVSGNEVISGRQDGFQQEFADFTTRRASRRTGTEPEISREQIPRRREVSLLLMLRRLQQDHVEQTAQVRRDQAAERARQQQSISNQGRNFRGFRQFRERFLGP